MDVARRHRPIELLLVTLVLGATQLLLAPALVSVDAATHTGGPALAFPSPGASLTVWDAWAAAQKQAIESQPYAQLVTAQGLILRKLYFVNVPNAPGIPAGVTTTAAVVIASSAGASSPNVTAAPTSAALATNCSGFSNGLGSACIDAYYNSGLYWEATSELYVATDGKLNLGDGGCPGQRDVVTTGLVYVSAYQTVELYYGPVNFSQTWDSRWWDDATGSYQSWGYACLTE